MNETAKIIEKMQAKKMPAEQVERVRGVLERVENRLEPMPDFAAEIIAGGNARQRGLPGYATREVRRDA